MQLTSSGFIAPFISKRAPRGGDAAPGPQLEAGAAPASALPSCSAPPRRIAAFRQPAPGVNMSAAQDGGPATLPCVLITSCDPGFREEDLVKRKWPTRTLHTPASWAANRGRYPKRPRDPQRYTDRGDSEPGPPGCHCFPRWVAAVSLVVQAG